jgi:hypothetical protein
MDAELPLIQARLRSTLRERRMKRILLFFALFLIGTLPCNADCSIVTTGPNKSPKCYAPFGFPVLAVHCTSPSSFWYNYWGNFNPAAAPQRVPVAQGTYYEFGTSDVFGMIGEACWNPPFWTCVSFGLYEPPNYCGALPPTGANFCKQCEQTGGACSVGPGGRKFCIHQ